MLGETKKEEEGKHEETKNMAAITGEGNQARNTLAYKEDGCLGGCRGYSEGRREESRRRGGGENRAAEAPEEVIEKHVGV